VKALQDEGITVDYHVLDVTNAVGIKALAGYVAKRHGGLDILVNNAGVLLDPQGSRIPDSRAQTYRETLETNLFGPLLLTQALLPLMRKNGYGRIVNLSSGLAQLAGMGVGSPAYRISKTALNAFTATLAAELAGSGILVNAACPGWVRTAMGGPHAPVSVEEGADTAVWLATLPADGPNGGFFKARKPIPW
jgi:NAD(P)-dependent dehydrogenase (short-subunit alcohol dehydrogenase family)